MFVGPTKLNDKTHIRVFLRKWGAFKTRFSQVNALEMHCGYDFKGISYQREILQNRKKFYHKMLAILLPH